MEKREQVLFVEGDGFPELPEPHRYRVVFTDTIPDLTWIVNGYIMQHGYQAIGGVTAIIHEGKPQYCQAITLPDTTEITKVEFKGGHA